MKAYVFPGQGSQSKGMGAKLFDAYPDLTAQADEILGYSIKKLCLEDPNEELRQTQFTQPALYVVSALSYLQKVRETGSEPDYVAGHSVGEYAALFAAGAYDFATGLKLIQKRGALMATASGGGMAAVIGMSEEQIHETLRGIGKDSIDIANFNTPSQIVIAGPHQDILQLAPAFDEAGASNYIPLKVSGAFHSRYMKPSQDEFATYLQDFSFQPLRIPVISNITSRPYRNEDVHHNLTYQIMSSVRWTDSIRYLMALGVEEIEEVGPGRALTGMLVKIRKEAEPLVLEAEIIDSQLEAMPKHEEQPHTVEKPQVEGRPAAYAEVAQEEAAPIVITAEQSHASTLGDEEFKKDYNIKYAYVVGSMHKGISSVDMVVRLGKAGLLGYFGSAGLPIAQVEEALRQIRAQLRDDQAFGVNFPFSPNDSQWEEKLVDLFLRNEVRNVEASGFMSITPALVRYRLHGLQRQVNGEVVIKHRILAKVARPEVAEMFLSPAPERIVKKMLEAGQLTQADAELLKRVPLADDLCVVADSGGPTEQGVAYALMPVMLKLREEAMSRHGYAKRIRVGAAGGIGSPEAVAAAFVLGAEFIMTGSINQCTVEAGTSAYVKDLLNDINVQDTAYAPAEEQFEMGAKVQVLKKGLFFPARANKLFHLYNQYNSIHEIDEKTKKQLQEKYFGRTFERVYEELATYVPAADLERAAKHPKLKMAMIFKWYLRNATQLAIQGDLEKKVDFQVQCGPALGSFNQWVKGSPLESWKNRRVSDIADLLMQETATLLAQRLKVLV